MHEALDSISSTAKSRQNEKTDIVEEKNYIFFNMKIRCILTLKNKNRKEKFFDHS